MPENPYESPVTRSLTRPRMSCAPFAVAGVVLALGAFLIPGSAVYHVLTIGLPAPDATPEEVVHNNFHFGMSQAIFYAGIIVFLIGCALLGCAFAWPVKFTARRGG